MKTTIILLKKKFKLKNLKQQSYSVNWDELKKVS